MKSISFLKIAAVAAFMAVGISISAPAQAGASSWSGTATGPIMYQSNWDYHSSVISPPSGLPSTARVYYLAYSAKFSRYPSGLQVYLCSTTSVRCYYMGGVIGRGYVTPGIYGASDQFQFGFRDQQYKAYTYSSHFQSNPVGGGHQLTITYQY